MSSDNATALEDYQEHLEIKAAHWMFDHVNDTDFEPVLSVNVNVVPSNVIST